MMKTVITFYGLQTSEFFILKSVLHLLSISTIGIIEFYFTFNKQYTSLIHLNLYVNTFNYIVLEFLLSHKSS